MAVTILSHSVPSLKPTVDAMICVWWTNTCGNIWKYNMYIIYYIYVTCVFLVVHLLSRILRWSRTFWYLPAQLLASGVPFVRLKPWRSKNLKARKTCQKRKVLGHIGIIDLKNHLRIWIQATYIMPSSKTGSKLISIKFWGCWDRILGQSSTFMSVPVKNTNPTISFWGI